jgi:hypothetical protein
MIYWKTNTKEIAIHHMSKEEILKASVKCMRKLQFHSSVLESLKQLKKENQNIALYCTHEIANRKRKCVTYSELLELMDIRAMQLGFEIPENILDTDLMRAFPINEDKPF